MENNMKRKEKVDLLITRFGSRQAMFNHYLRYENGKLYRKIGDTRKAVGHMDRQTAHYTGVGGVRFQTTIVVYEMHFGDIPLTLKVGHINKDNSDNRLENLYLTNESLKVLTSKVYNTNTSGVRGVSWQQQRGKWIARIMRNSKAISLGAFNSISNAEAVYNEVLKKSIEITREEIKEIVKKYKQLESAA
jgi:hypothetical protein